MSTAFYFDEHVPRAITVGLRLRGVDVLTVQDDERRGLSDEKILDRAAAPGRVVFTQDDDFLGEARRRQEAGSPFAGVIYAHQRVSIGVCVSDLALIAHAANIDDLMNRVEYLPL